MPPGRPTDRKATSSSSTSAPAPPMTKLSFNRSIKGTKHLLKPSNSARLRCQPAPTCIVCRHMEFLTSTTTEPLQWTANPTASHKSSSTVASANSFNANTAKLQTLFSFPLHSGRPLHVREVLQPGDPDILTQCREAPISLLVASPAHVSGQPKRQ